MAENEKYREQYCEKHNQYYASFLPRCPICVGDEMNGSMKKDKKEASKNMEDKGV